MTLRIDITTAEQLEAVAQVEGVPVSEVITRSLVREVRGGVADGQILDHYP